jgi:tRNA A-37 threonylcarbamoyl transferase component Bud32
MARPRAPWWIFAVAVSVLSYLGLMLYADALGPGGFGMGLRFREGRVLVVEVVPDYPAARAGIEPGDQVVAAAGQPVKTVLEWCAVAENAEVGRPFILEIERGGQPRRAVVTFEAHWRRWSAGTWVTFLAKVTAKLVTFGLALVIALRRPHDLVALVGALWLAALSITDFVPTAVADPHVPQWSYGAPAMWRSLPLWLSAPLWVGCTIFLLGPPLSVVFLSTFPRPVLRTRRGWWLWGLTWAPLSIVGFPAMLFWTYRALYDPAHSTNVLPDWFTPLAGVIVLGSVGIALTLLVINYRRLVDQNERRRVRVLVLGVFVGLSGLAPIATASFFDFPPVLQTALRSPAARASASALFLALPLSFAYAILRHRLLDVGLIVRQGLQYALARRLVVSVVPACALLLVLDLAVHGDQPLRTVLQSRGWIYAAVAALAFAAHVRQQRWLGALDRRFFRERYDAQRLLREVVEEAGRAASLERAAPQVVARVEAALHPEFVALLVRAPRDPAFRTLASAPGPTMGLALRADSKLLGVARLLGRPLEVEPGESGWLKEQLPHEETTFLREARIGLIVPIAMPPGGAEALLVLGVKRSEEPYSREDQELLAAVAASLGLLAERPGAARSTAAFEECPRCGACYDSGAVACDQEGARLETVPLPRMLADRYRLARRLGRGGMGTVYEAADTSLERRVAVKVIREDLVGSAEAAERFRREARAAASFSHPNVVTVYDFGVAAERRAFLVMELLRGATLRETLRDERRLDAGRALGIVRDLCAAVEAAHQQQLVHRDLKPENVFLARDGGNERVKVLDFGIAKFLTSDAETGVVTGTGRLVGTLHYMGPEQLRGGIVEAGWDLWALAVMAYEMLTGVLPFPSVTPVDYQSAVLAGRSTPIRAQLPEASERLEAFFVGALAVDPRQRPSRAPIFAVKFAEAVT